MLLVATMAATIFCSSASCLDILFGPVSAPSDVAGVKAHGCCAPPADADAATAPAEPVPSDAPGDCGNCLFMAGTFHSQWSGSDLAVPLPKVVDLPNWLTELFGAAASGDFWQDWQRRELSACLAPPAMPHQAAASCWRASARPAACQTRPQLGVFLI